jgi:hypothetical protein
MPKAETRQEPIRSKKPEKRSEQNLQYPTARHPQERSIRQFCRSVGHIGAKKRIATQCLSPRHRATESEWTDELLKNFGVIVAPEDEEAGCEFERYLFQFHPAIRWVVSVWPTGIGWIES